MEDKNYFVELNKIEWEVSKKQNLSYISWANAWDMVKREYPNSTYVTYENIDWFPFFESKFGIDVKVWVTVNDIEHIVRLPVMDWANKAMKAEKYSYTTKYWDKDVLAATQFDINKAIQRAFTKAIAMHGVWLYVFRWEDLPEQEEIIKPKFTAEIFEVMKEKTNFKNYFEAKQNIDAKYELDLKLAKIVKAYYETKAEWVKLTDDNLPPF